MGHMDARKMPRCKVTTYATTHYKGKEKNEQYKADDSIPTETPATHTSKKNIRRHGKYGNAESTWAISRAKRRLKRKRKQKEPTRTRSQA